MTPSPTPIPSWVYWPNLSDLRSIAADSDTLWIASLSGMIRYRPADNHWRVWTTADGLIDNTCESIVRWHDALWIGTQGGISRYEPDLDRWQSYTTEKGLPGLSNVRLYVDRYAGVLWAGTFEGLATYDPLADRWTEQTVAGRPLAGVTQIVADASSVWISTDSEPIRGIWRLDKKTGNWQDISAVEGAPPRDLYALAGHESVVWALSSRGVLYEYDGPTEAWRTRAQLRAQQILAPPALTYYEQDLWIGAQTGLIRLALETQQLSYVRFPPDTYPAPQGPPALARQTAWLPTASGLVALDLASESWSYHAPVDRPQHIRGILLSEPDELLVSTREGLGFLDPHSGAWRPVQHVSKEAPWAQVWAARQPGRADLWVYAPPVGLPSPDEALNVWHYGHDDGPVTDAIALPLDSEPPTRLLPLVDAASLWFQTHDALLAYDLNTQRWRSYKIKSQAGYLTEADQEPGAIWLLAGGETMVRFDTQRHNLTMYPIPLGRGWGHVARSELAVWLGGESNVVLAFDPATLRWTEHTLDTACLGSRVTALDARSNIVWIGGEHGTIRYDVSTMRQRCYADAHAMLNDRVTQIVVDDEWVWFVHPWRGLWGTRSSERAEQGQ